MVTDCQTLTIHHVTDHIPQSYAAPFDAVRGRHQPPATSHQPPGAMIVIADGSASRAAKVDQLAVHAQNCASTRTGGRRSSRSGAPLEIDGHTS